MGLWLGACAYYGTGICVLPVHGVMKINWGKYTFKINLISLYRTYRKIMKLIKKWRKDNVLEEDIRGRDGNASNGK